MALGTQGEKLPFTLQGCLAPKMGPGSRVDPKLGVWLLCNPWDGYEVVPAQGAFLWVRHQGCTSAKASVLVKPLPV